MTTTADVVSVPTPLQDPPVYVTVEVDYVTQAIIVRPGPDVKLLPALWPYWLRWMICEQFVIRSSSYRIRVQGECVIIRRPGSFDKAVRKVDASVALLRPLPQLPLHRVHQDRGEKFTTYWCVTDAEITDAAWFGLKWLDAERRVDQRLKAIDLPLNCRLGYSTYYRVSTKREYMMIVLTRRKNAGDTQAKVAQIVELQYLLMNAGIVTV